MDTRIYFLWCHRYIFFFGHAHGIQKFPGQGSNRCPSGDNTGSLTPWTTVDIWRYIINLLDLLLVHTHHQKGKLFHSLCTPLSEYAWHLVGAQSLLFFFFLFRLHQQDMEVPQARGQIGAAAADLGHSHSNIRSERRLWPTLQVSAMLDP